MNIKFKSLVLFILYFSISCRVDDSKKFSEFFPTVPVINKPIAVICGWPKPSIPYYTDILDGVRYAELQADVNHRKDSILIVKYNMGDIVYGRLYEHEAFVTFLCGSYGGEFGELTVQTFSTSGVKIDSLKIGGGCGGGGDWWSEEYATIGDDRYITKIDTTYKWADPKRRAFEPDTTLVKIIQYELMKTGQFAISKDTLFTVKQ